MKTVFSLVLACAGGVAAHGYVKAVNIDNNVYPGFDPSRDAFLGYKRVAFTYQPSMANFGGQGAIQDVNSNDMACNSGASPAGMIASARAGSNMDFIWTKFLRSHKGPITTWMAPYEGETSQVKVNDLKFFKIHEAGIYPDGSWGIEHIQDANGAWNTTIPHDIKPGKYVVRHELVALHFATENSNYWYIPSGKVAPQFYISCYNIEVTGNGSATPPGVKFPGAYTPQDAGWHFDIFKNNKKYPMPGPEVYKPTGPIPQLQKNPLKFISPTGTNDAEKDAKYNSDGEKLRKEFEKTTDMFQAIGG